MDSICCGFGSMGCSGGFLLGLSGNGFTWQMFVTGAFINSIPGIVLQLIFIPAVMAALNRTGLVRFVRQTDPLPNAEN